MNVAVDTRIEGGEPSETTLATTVLTFAKAILKSGYYTAGHGQAMTAAQEFVESLGALGDRFDFIEFRRAGQQPGDDILVLSDLQLPLAFKRVLGGGPGEMFQEKLANVFEARRILSVTLRGLVSATEAVAFFGVIDQLPALSEEEVDKALAVANVLNMSLLIEQKDSELSQSLSWHLKVALQRMRKDIGALPLYSGLTDDQILDIHKQVGVETIHGIRRPELLAELICNIDLVVKYVKMQSKDWFVNLLSEEIPDQAFGEVFESVCERLEQQDDQKMEVKATKKTLQSLVGGFDQEQVHLCYESLQRLFEYGIIGFESLNADALQAFREHSEMLDIGSQIMNRVNRLRDIEEVDEAINELKQLGKQINGLAEHDPDILNEKLWGIVNFLGFVSKDLSDDSRSLVEKFLVQVVTRYADMVLESAPALPWDPKRWEGLLGAIGADVIIALGSVSTQESSVLVPLIRLVPDGSKIRRPNALLKWIDDPPTTAHQRMAFTALRHCHSMSLIETRQLIPILENTENHACRSYALTCFLENDRVDSEWVENLIKFYEKGTLDETEVVKILDYLRTNGPRFKTLGQPLSDMLAMRVKGKNFAQRPIKLGKLARSGKENDKPELRMYEMAALASLPGGEKIVKKLAGKLPEAERQDLVELLK